MFHYRRKLGNKIASVMPLIFWKELSLTSSFHELPEVFSPSLCKILWIPLLSPQWKGEDEYLTLTVALNDLKGLFRLYQLHDSMIQL